MDIKRGRADVNGAELHYLVAGAGDAIVFIHGLTLDHRMWDQQLPVFASQFRVVALDLRGFGSSDNPLSGVPFSHADDVKGLLTHLGIERAHVVGLSMGGGIAQEFALKYPEAVKTLILVDSALGGYVFSPRFAATLQALYTLGREGKLAETKAQWVADPLFAYSATVPGVSAQLAQMVEDYGSWIMLNDDPQVRVDPPTIHQLGTITAPTLVIVGEHDIPDFHTIGKLLVDGIPGAQLKVLPDAGHMANMDAPDAFNETVLRFIAEYGVSRPA